MTPAVTVVVPCFNLGAYLDEAVQSVLDQTYEDFEILIVDDGSDDPVTRHLLTSYRRPRTRIIRTDNRGLSAARNTGLEEASGRYVTFLDADDVFEPRFLERTIAELDADDSLAFAGCWLRMFGVTDWLWQPTSCDFPWLLAEDTVCTPAPMRRDAVTAVGGYDEDDRINGHQDWELAIALVANGFRGTIVPEVLFRYRIRPDSMSSVVTEREYHVSVVEYLLDKYADEYRAHAEGVIAAIKQRTEALSEHLADPLPPYPDVSGRGWREAILVLEAHRRGIEELLPAPATPDDAGPGKVDLGGLRRVEPVSRVWGLDRGQPIDRYYIDRFLTARAEVIRGDVLEVKDPGYTRSFGREVSSATILDVAEQNAQATLVADLGEAGTLPEERYDCILLVQTAHFVFDLHEVVRNLHRGLAPGGSVLATLPCVSRVDYESGVDGDMWRFTEGSARRLFESVFGADGVELEVFGNVLASTSFLHGLATAELTPDELDHTDRYFPLLIGVHATKSQGAPARARQRVVEGHLDRATCSEVTGWAWDREAPEQRLRAEVFLGERPIGDAWADSFREDLAEAGKADGRVAFRFKPDRPLHPADGEELSVRTAGGHELQRSPRSVECVCATARSPGLAGCAIDSPKAGQQLTSPWLELGGWALGGDAPVETVELLHRGEVFRRVPVGRRRRDLAEAFPDVPWAGRSGFRERVSLVAAANGGGLEAYAVLASGERAVVGDVEPVLELPALDQVVVGLDRSGSTADPASLLRQRATVGRVVAVGGMGPAGHPGFETGTDSWSTVFEEQDALVWLCDGREAVGPSFLEAAVDALREIPAAAFAVAAGPASTRGDLTGVLSGTALGTALVFRASAVLEVGGVDEAAVDAITAQWDLGIRLAASGYDSVEIDSGTPAAGASLAELAGDAARWVYTRHEDLFEEHLEEILLDREDVIGQLLRSNHLVERALESDLRQVVRARRRERDRLAGKLRRSRGGHNGSDRHAVWGDLRRQDPFSPLWGAERGLCVDRYYIERFLDTRAHEIAGVVLECDGAAYTERYGGGRVTRVDVIDVDPTNPDATVVADLADASAIADSTYDCVLLTQVLQFLEDAPGAIAECRRILRPDGVLLATVPCVSRVNGAPGPIVERWRWSAEGFAALLASAFDPQMVDVRAAGSRNAAVALLAGLAAEEMPPGRLERFDPDAPLILTARVGPPGGDAP